MNFRLERIRSVLLRQTTLALATVDASCRPRSTPLFFLSDEHLRLYWFSSKSSLHSRNCARNPLAAVAVYQDARVWREIQGVQMEGSVSRITDRALRKKIAGDYCERFQLGDVLGFAVRRSSLYCFTPAWVRFIDNSEKFGYKFELSLTRDLPAG
jgi:uncharacterized protein YhbP (UPF0306 family)